MFELVIGLRYFDTYVQGLEVSEPAPRNLYLTAALLIREGFITVEDLYPHVRPVHCTTWICG